MAALGNPDRQIQAIFATAQQADRLADNLQHIAACHRPLLDNIEILEREQMSQLCQSGTDTEQVHQGLAIHTNPLEEMFLSDILLHLDNADEAEGRGTGHTPAGAGSGHRPAQCRCDVALGACVRG